MSSNSEAEVRKERSFMMDKFRIAMVTMSNGCSFGSQIFSVLAIINNM